jgi:C-terminal processing protease CtpA/Prc
MIKSKFHELPLNVNNFKRMKDLMKLSLLFLFSVGILMSCSDDDPVPDPDGSDQQASALTQKINRFIKEGMTDYYLWYDKMPDIDYKTEQDSKEYFEKLLYEVDTEKGWSFITDDIVALRNSFAGREKTYGWSLSFGRFSNSDDVFAVVEFVYPNTPAGEANVKRGDFVIGMDGGPLTLDNYLDVLYSDNATFQLGALNDQGQVANSGSVTMTSKELDLNPIVKNEVIEVEDTKIGYLLYASYIDNYNDALDTAFQSLVDQGVSDVVVDLRYNGGGAVTSAVHLCSILAPLDVVNNGNKLVKMTWNDKIQQYFVDNQIMHQIEETFDSEVPVKMGLSSVRFLTTGGTASASELTITGLSPYMTVRTIGETTHGKYTASITITPEDYYYDKDNSYFEEFKNWAIQPIVLRYANSVGVTDFKEGFEPDIEVEDDLTKQLGSLDEPMLAAAIEDITGTPPIIALKSAQKPEIFNNIFDRGFSKYDKFKQELLVDQTRFKLKK